MKAINITEELKNLNPSLFSGILNVGTIKTFKELPKSFKSLTWQNGRLTEGYHKLDNSVHEADGFFDLVTPSFDKATEKLGDIFFSVYDIETPEQEIVTISEFTYNVVARTQAELDTVVKDDFKNNLEGAFVFATTPDGTKEYAIKIGNDGKISTVLIP